jgi:SAM-dependent methyltransferase
MSGTTQVEDLLTGVESADGRDGFLDTLGERDPIISRPAHQLFRKRAFLRIYERLWRPTIARLSLGLTGPRVAEEQRIALEMLDVRPGQRVIDVGCGPGNYTRPLARAAGDGLTVGLDASEVMLASAAEQGGGENLVYVRGDACALPFADGSFDFACSVGVIHMVEEPLLALEEMVRVLAPGGRLMVLATCATRGRPRHERGGLTFFARDDLTGALSGHGMTEIEQRVFRRGQFVSARKPSEGAHNGN